MKRTLALLALALTAPASASSPKLLAALEDSAAQAQSAVSAGTHEAAFQAGREAQFVAANEGPGCGGDPVRLPPGSGRQRQEFASARHYEIPQRVEKGYTDYHSRVPEPKAGKGPSRTGLYLANIGLFGLIGAAVGAGIGALIGGGPGAVAGAVVGGLAGGIFGYVMAKASNAVIDFINRW